MKDLPAQLFQDGLWFQATFSNREGADEMVAQARKHGVSLATAPYGVNIKRIDPRNGDTLKWEKCAGVSVWGTERRQSLELAR